MSKNTIFGEVFLSFFAFLLLCVEEMLLKLSNLVLISKCRKSDKK